ncbi:MAG: phosphatase PAP2 family protein [Anaerolineae bacterium]|nr:phosphatase PAP2 family protein [Anaerolineae bacterium]
MTSSKPNWKKSNWVEQLLILDAWLTQQLTLPLESNWRGWAGRVAHLGDGPLVFGGLGLVYGLGWWADAPLLCQTVQVLLTLILAAILIVTLVKFRVRRRRPHPPGEFVAFAYDVYSFPSGHAARLAALAVGVLFFDTFLGWSLIILALSVALARVLVGVHYLSDILIGLTLGGLVAWVGLLAVKFLEFVL